MLRIIIGDMRYYKILGYMKIVFPIGYIVYLLRTYLYRIGYFVFEPHIVDPIRDIFFACLRIMSANLNMPEVICRN